MKARPASLVLAAVAAGAGASAHAADVPFLTGRVVDTAEILTPATRERLTAELQAHEGATGNQVVVLTVPTIGGEPIEDYASKVFAAWKLGQKGKDNGVLLVVVPRDRRMRIEVGYGLEPTLTDVASGRIVRDVMTPAFKAGDFDKGVSDGVHAIVGQLEGKPVAAGTPPASRGRHRGRGLHLDGGDRSDMPWPARILLAAFIFGIIGLFTYAALITPAAGWFLYVFLIPFWALFPLMIMPPEAALPLLAVYVIGVPVAKIFIRRTAWYRKAAAELESKGSARIGGLVIGSGGSGGSSSGGGGFSGGGGSSGGGGASGSW